MLPADSDADKVKILDETDWPGGVVQKFRALRPLVEGLVDGWVARLLHCCVARTAAAAVCAAVVDV